MLRVVESLLIFIAVSESILGILGNGFIGLVNCIDCAKSKKFSVIGLILIGLSISRILLIWIIITDGFIKIFSPDMYFSANIVDFISYSWLIINHLSIWFAASLSIFYFLKIANFSHHIFLWFKRRINRVLPLLMGSMFVSWLLSFPQTVKMINYSKLSNRNRTTTWQLDMPISEYFAYQALLNLGVLSLFTLALIACFLLIISLWRHNRRMRLNAPGARDARAEAHVKAMKVLISFIVLFVVHFIGIAIEISCFTLPENKLLLIIGMTTTAVYPWGHSLILILGNSKLQQASLKVLHSLKCCGNEEAPGTR